MTSLTTRDPDLRRVQIMAIVSYFTPDRKARGITLVVKRLSSLPSKQGAGVRLPPSVAFFSLNPKRAPSGRRNVEVCVVEGPNVLRGQVIMCKLHKCAV